MSVPPASQIARLLLRMARGILPAKRREWGEAMQAEAAAVPESAHVGWAFGCLFAACRSRFAPMNTGTFHVNRWVMLVETVGCFGPALLAWFVFTFGPSPGVLRMSSEVMERVYLDVPGGGFVLALIIGFAVSGLIAPLGLFLGLRYVASNRALRNRKLGYILVAAPLLQSLLGMVCLLWTNAGDFAVRTEVFMLLTVMPVAGILHLMYLGRPEPSAAAQVAVS